MDLAYVYELASYLFSFITVIPHTIIICFKLDSHINGYDEVLINCWELDDLKECLLDINPEVQLVLLDLKESFYMANSNQGQR